MLFYDVVANVFNLGNDLGHELIGNLDVCDLVLLNDKHAVDLLGLRRAHLCGDAHVVVYGLESVNLLGESLEVVVGAGVGVNHNLEDLHDVLLLAETVGEALILGLLDDGRCDVDALNPCADHDGRRDVRALLLTEVAVNLVEAGHRELLQRVEVSVVLGHAAEEGEVEELANSYAVGKSLDGREVVDHDEVLAEGVDVAEVGGIYTEVDGALERGLVVALTTCGVERALLELHAGVHNLVGHLDRRGDVLNHVANHLGADNEGGVVLVVELAELARLL